MQSVDTRASRDKSPAPQGLTLSIDLIDPFGPVEVASIRPAAELFVADLNRECEVQGGRGRFALGQGATSAAGDRFKFEVHYKGGERATIGEAQRILRCWSERLMREQVPGCTVHCRGMGELPPAP